MICQNENIDISQYGKLIDLFKIKAKGLQPEKAKVLTPEEINKFISDAPNQQHLATKVNICRIY